MERCDHNGSNQTTSGTNDILSECLARNISIQDNSLENSTLEILSDSECEDRFENTVADYLWKIFPPILLSCGLLGNILTIVVLRRMRAHKQPTMLFVLFLAVSDTVVLVTGLPRYWILYVFGYDVRTASDVNCKLYYFCIYLSMQYSSWILVGVAVERVIKTQTPTKYRYFFSVFKVTVGLISTLVVLILINFHFFFTNGVNDFTESDCGSLSPEFYYFDENIFVFIDFSIVCLLPIIAMTICNIFIIRALTKATKRRASMVHSSVLHRVNSFSIRMTKMLVVCSLYFLIATAPVSIYFILDTYLTPELTEENNCHIEAKMNLLWTISYLVQFSNSCINFYLYTSMNDRFYKEFKNLLCCHVTDRRTMIYSTRHEITRNTVSSSTIPTYNNHQDHSEESTVTETTQT